MSKLIKGLVYIVFGSAIIYVCFNSVDVAYGMEQTLLYVSTAFGGLLTLRGVVEVLRLIAFK
jgi:hypothetical protein